MIRGGGSRTRDRLVYGFRLVTSRRPSAVELALLTETVARRVAFYRQHPAAAHGILGVGSSQRDVEIDVEEHAAWTAVGRLLINLSETLTKG